MKIFSLCAILLLSQLASANTAIITCDRSTKAERADSIQKIQYRINLDSGAAALGCSEKTNSDFCKSIRMDLSKTLPSLTLDCRNQNDQVQKTYRFLLVQEDEFENQIQIQVSRSCATGKIEVPAQLKASILSYQSGDFESGRPPFAVDAVDCSALLPGQRR